MAGLVPAIVVRTVIPGRCAASNYAAHSRTENLAIPDSMLRIAPG